MWGRPVFYGGCVFMFLNSFLICLYIKEIHVTLSEEDLLHNWFSMRWVVATLNILPPQKNCFVLSFLEINTTKTQCDGFWNQEKNIYLRANGRVTQGFVTSLGCNVLSNQLKLWSRFLLSKKCCNEYLWKYIIVDPGNCVWVCVSHKCPKLCLLDRRVCAPLIFVDAPQSCPIEVVWVGHTSHVFPHSPAALLIAAALFIENQYLTNYFTLCFPYHAWDRGCAKSTIHLHFFSGGASWLFFLCHQSFSDWVTGTLSIWEAGPSDCEVTVVPTLSFILGSRSGGVPIRFSIIFV